MKASRITFQKKIYFYCLTLNLILLFICFLAFYYYTSNSLRQNTEDSLISNTSILMNDLDDLLDTADDTLKELQLNEDLLAECKEITNSEANYFPVRVPESYSFQNIFRTILISRNLNGSIRYISKYHDNIGVSSSLGYYTYLSKDILQEQPELAELLGSSFYVTYLAPHPDYSGSESLVFSVVRSMRDTFHSYGILVLDFDVSAIKDLLDVFEAPEDYSIAILDTHQELVFISDPSMDTAAFLRAFHHSVQSGQERTFSHLNTSLSCYDVSPLTGWTFILTTNTAKYLESTRQLLVISSLLFASLFLVISTFLYLVTQRLTRPLRQLTAQLEHMEISHNIDTSQFAKDDEIAVLTNAVKSFLDEIYDKNIRLNAAHRRTLLAHYNAMEAELNPHFLYNTLTVIGMTGLNSGSTTVSTMCSELSYLLRYSLSYTGQSVLLEQEIANVKSYLYIMKMRYEEDLICTWDLDESLGTITVPKLILQPLVENCFHHGFQHADYEISPPWKIKIRSFGDHEYWYLSISNNGAPFDEATLRRLTEQLKQPLHSEYSQDDGEYLQKRHGYGLENTLLRLCIYYDNNVFFQVSREDDWTNITIGGPLKPEKLFHGNEMRSIV